MKPEQQRKKLKVLLVEDDKTVSGVISLSFRHEGIEPVIAPDITSAREKIDVSGKGTGYDLIILDLKLPDGSGFDFLSGIRENGIETPVLILSSKDAEIDKVKGLRMGADDYLVKPFSLAELYARIEAIMRRVRKATVMGADVPDVPDFTDGDLCVDMKSREVRVAGKLVKLTQTEFDILRFLVERRGNVAGRMEIIRFVWGGEFIDSGSLDPHVSRLRKKISPCGDAIETVSGIGYIYRA